MIRVPAETGTLQQFHPNSYGRLGGGRNGVEAPRNVDYAGFCNMISVAVSEPSVPATVFTWTRSPTFRSLAVSVVLPFRITVLLVMVAVTGPFVLALFTVIDASETSVIRPSSCWV